MNQEIVFFSREEESGSRLDKLVLAHYPGKAPPRSRIQAWIRNGLVSVENVKCLKPSQNIAAGQQIKMNIPDTAAGPLPVKGILEEIYRDDHILVLNKQPGISVHPAPSLDEPTLVNYLLERYQFLGSSFTGERPGIVHRLDKDTSGVMVVALDPDSGETLSRLFHDRNVVKEYLAIVKGCPEAPQGEINMPLGRDPKTRVKIVKTINGRKALTRYRVIFSGHDRIWSLIRLEILTGRTHQIRAHMAELGYPVLGDGLYGGSTGSSWGFRQNILSRLVKRQLLHSTRLGFCHPATNQCMDFVHPPPADFMRTMLYLERRLQRVVITGGMGSGKTRVILMLEKMGFPVFIADKCVADLYKPGNDGWRIIRDRFGNRFIRNDHEPVDKVKLARAASEEEHFLEELSHLIHPLVNHRLEEFWKEHQAERLAFAEIPLVFEARMQKACDLVVGVFCPDSVRHERLMKNRNISSQHFAILDSMQMSQAEKISKCDLILDNSSDLSELEHKVMALTRVLRFLRSREAAEKCRLLDSLMSTEQSQTHLGRKVK